MKENIAYANIYYLSIPLMAYTFEKKSWLMVYWDNICLHMPFWCCFRECFRYAMYRQMKIFKYINCNSVCSVESFNLYERKNKNSWFLCVGKNCQPFNIPFFDWLKLVGRCNLGLPLLGYLRIWKDWPEKNIQENVRKL